MCIDQTGKNVASRKRIGIHYRLVVPHPNLIDPPRLGLMAERKAHPAHRPATHPTKLYAPGRQRGRWRSTAPREDRAMG